MKKSELEEIVCSLREFVYLMHGHANLPIPDIFNPEDQALVCKNAIYRKAQVEYATSLLMANNTKEEMVDLTRRMSKVDWLAVSDESERQLDEIPFGMLPDARFDKLNPEDFQSWEDVKEDLGLSASAVVIPPNQVSADIQDQTHEMQA